jgi:tellurium resistance protein TerD
MFHYLWKDDTHFSMECSNCGRAFKYENKYLVSADDKGCTTNTPLSCSCGYVSPGTYFPVKPAAVPKEDPDAVKCPKCKSTQITAGNKGFSAGKAVAGAVLTGGVGLLAGFLGSKKVMVTCLKCGHKWEAGKK